MSEDVGSIGGETVTPDAPVDTGVAEGKQGGVSRRQAILAGGMGAAGLLAGGSATALAKEKALWRGRRNSVAALKFASNGLLIHVPAGAGTYNLGVEVGFHEGLHRWAGRSSSLPQASAFHLSRSCRQSSRRSRASPTCSPSPTPAAARASSSIAQAIKELPFVICTNQYDAPYTASRA